MSSTSVELEQNDNGIEPKEVIKVVLLLGLAFYFADVVFSNNLKNYTNQMPEWLALLTSGLFLLLGVASGVGLFKRSRASDRQEIDEEHVHAVQSSRFKVQ